RWAGFFFSSRRRHTRSDRDWSSDVCSSDLRAIARAFAGEGASVIVGDLGDSAEAAAAAIRAEGGRAVAARADVTRAEDMRALARSEERRVGKEGSARGRAGHSKAKNTRRTH